VVPGIIWKPGNLLHASCTDVQAHDEMVGGAPNVSTNLKKKTYFEVLSLSEGLEK
jgi:hypothetical protein